MQTYSIDDYVLNSQGKKYDNNFIVIYKEIKYFVKKYLISTDCTMYFTSNEINRIFELRRNCSLRAHTIHVFFCSICSVDLLDWKHFSQTFNMMELYKRFTIPENADKLRNKRLVQLIYFTSLNALCTSHIRISSDAYTVNSTF